MSVCERGREREREEVTLMNNKKTWGMIEKSVAK